MNDKEQPDKFWIGFLLGAVIAGAAMFLLGSKRGKELLEELLEKIEAQEEKLADTVDVLKEKSTALLEKTEEVKDAVIAQLEENTDRVSDMITAHIDETLTEEVHRKFFKKDGKTLTS